MTIKRKIRKPFATKYDYHIDLPLNIAKFLNLECKRLTEKLGKRVQPTNIVRALAASYYEKRLAGLLVNPDD